MLNIETKELKISDKLKRKIEMIGRFTNTTTIINNKYVIISKNANPVIHFVIKHPKLVEAIDNFNPLVKE